MKRTILNASAAVICGTIMVIANQMDNDSTVSIHDKNKWELFGTLALIGFLFFGVRAFVFLPKKPPIAPDDSQDRRDETE